MLFALKNFHGFYDCNSQKTMIFKMASHWCFSSQLELLKQKISWDFHGQDLISYDFLNDVSFRYVWNLFKKKCWSNITQVSALHKILLLCIFRAFENVVFQYLSISRELEVIIEIVACGQSAFLIYESHHCFRKVLFTIGVRFFFSNFQIDWDSSTEHLFCLKEVYHWQSVLSAFSVIRVVYWYP